MRNLIASGDVVTKVEGIFSGTLSYLFNAFEGDVPFSSLVRDAHWKGLTEPDPRDEDRKSTRLNSSHITISYAVFCLKKKTIHILRMPVSPSGRRFRCGPAAAESVRNTVSESGNGMLPPK